MANYYGVGKTNSFAVKDIEAFREEVGKYAVEIAERKVGGETLVTLFDNDDNGGGFPWTYYDPESFDAEDIEWGEIFARHLVEGWVAIITEVGNEKYRYLGGMAIAFNSKGEHRKIDIGEITKLAEEIGSNF
jgi:hypothetical protein